MKVYIVTETQIDYDDYPIGMSWTLLATTNEADARALTGYPYPPHPNSRMGKPGHARYSRSLQELEVEHAGDS